MCLAPFFNRDSHVHLTHHVLGTFFLIVTLMCISQCLAPFVYSPFDVGLYSVSPATRTLKVDEKLFELVGFRVIGVN